MAVCDGDGEADARADPGAADDLGVDADDPALSVQQGPAGVARIDGGVRLDDLGDGEGARAAANSAANSADDALGHGEGLPEGVADGNRELADAHVAAVAEGDGVELVCWDINLDDGEVRAWVAAQNLRVGSELSEKMTVTWVASWTT